MGLLEKFQQGDGWNDPIVEGFDIVLEMIADDMEKYPNDYESEDIEFMMNFDWLNKEEYNKAYSFAEDWAEYRYCNYF